METFFDFGEHPGHLYVVGTLLPLASFLLLLLAGGLRMALRPYRESDGFRASLFQGLGGDNPKWPAYVATAAIGIACVLAVIGFVRLVGEHAEHEAEQKVAQQHDQHDEGEKKEEHPHVSGWADHVQWAWIGPRSVAEKEPARVLHVGYRIDHLAAVMFLMVTFIATLIHVFSIGYMSEELQPVVEDHHVHTEHGALHRRGRFGRFFMFLSLFCFSMLNLVIADNLFQIFVSWELVGICSYLLVGFYFERTSASNAANKAFITNRIGDAGFIIGLLIVWTYVGTFNFEDIFARIRAPEAPRGESVAKLEAQIVTVQPAPPRQDGRTQVQVTKRGEGSDVLLFPREKKQLKEASRLKVGDVVTLDQGSVKYETMPYWLLVVAGLGIFCGCVGKSAQFPLQVWLPDAMEGPTPVSALIHAATMVAAGVYLVGRCFPIFTAEALLVIAYTGGITLFVAATIALVMTDIKKVLAYSTVSQLGYMMLALGVGGWVAGLFHLITHAFFKALLFLCSGSVIYGCHHEQEMTRMGGLFPKMKITAITMLIGTLTIAGIPFFSGYYSKDAILAQALGFGLVYPQHILLFLLPLITAGITTFYMARMWFMTFTGEPRDPHVYEHAHESPRTMTVPLIILAFFSVVVAWGVPVWDAEAPLAGVGRVFTDGELEKHLHHGQYRTILADFGHVLEEGEKDAVGEAKPLKENVRHQAHLHHHLAGNLAFAIVLLSIVFASLVYYYRLFDPAEAKEQFPALHRFLWHKWYFDEVYSTLLVRPALAVAGWCRLFDNRVIDGTVDGTARATVKVSRWNGWFDNGIVDGLVNVTARAMYGVGNWMRNLQTGYIRSYVLFLVLAAVAIWVVLTMFVGPVPAQ
jgi:NADH-quinone oxidoreductase subunit L